jgi:C-terminal processing protease CtpA/Prc
MRRIFFILITILVVFAAKAQDISCRYGFSYEISNAPHWGKNKLVITSVYPHSPAERAGIKPYDIILAVDGTPVTENVLDDIYLFLNPEGKEIVELTIKNIAADEHKIKIKKECQSVYSISEEQLATAFAMYAAEDTHERLFSCPFVTTETKDELDFSVFKSFDFFEGSNEEPELARKIHDLIKKELMNRGLKHDPVYPDLTIQIFYLFNKNPNYKPQATKRTNKDDKPEEEYNYVNRYDLTRDRMVRFPFLPPNTIETEAQYILKLGFRMEDKKLQKGRIIWECETNEFMNESYSLENFAFVHIPLMCMQYPYMKYGRNVQFRLSKKKYNYTGIHYNIDRISEITSIDPYSPAAKAGLLPHDQIDAIADKRMDKTARQFTSAYRQFLVNTLKLRDENTRFVDANGFPDCMYWDKLKYPQIVRAFNNKKNLTVFSYLFQYAPFINPVGNNTCSFKLRRGKEKLEFILRPEIRTENTLVVE